MNEVKSICSLLKRAFEKNAWHGPSLKEALQHVDATMALQRLDNTHSIIELVNHMISWRTFVVKKLEGNRDYKVNDNENFPARENWAATLADLEVSQRDLIHAVDNFDAARLHDIVPHDGYQYTFYTLLHGIIHHDIYHIGQISLIKKSLTVGS